MRSVMIAALATSFLASISTPSLAQENAGDPVFRVPLGHVVPSTSIDPVYSWVESSSSCSTTCGTVTRTVSFQCQNMADFDTSAGDFGAPKPGGQCIGAIVAKPSGSSREGTGFSD